jgi:hypothetical protein
MRTNKFWPFDYDEEDEIYENPAWDMPGLKKNDGARRRTRSSRGTRQHPK